MVLNDIRLRNHVAVLSETTTLLALPLLARHPTISPKTNLPKLATSVLYPMDKTPHPLAARIDSAGGATLPP